jgi:hypothetical protein
VIIGRRLAEFPIRASRVADELAHGCRPALRCTSGAYKGEPPCRPGLVRVCLCPVSMRRTCPPTCVRHLSSSQRCWTDLALMCPQSAPARHALMLKCQLICGTSVRLWIRWAHQVVLPIGSAHHAVPCCRWFWSVYSLRGGRRNQAMPRPCLEHRQTPAGSLDGLRNPLFSASGTRSDPSAKTIRPQSTLSELRSSIWSGQSVQAPVT